MLKKVLVTASVVVGAFLLVALQTAAAGAGATRCSGTFSGTASDLIVPANGFCILDGATITHDVVVESNGFMMAANTTIGHDLAASKPQQVWTGFTDDGGGPVKVGHDIVISGLLTDQFGNHTCCPGINDTSVGHDLRVTGVLVDFELGVHNDDVGHDLVVSGNTTGLWIDVGDNSVGHDLVVSGNTAVGLGFGWISAYENVVRHDAICSENAPAEGRNSQDQLDFLGRTVGPNLVGHDDSCS
jgi:hypothetical protein